MKRSLLIGAALLAIAPIAGCAVFAPIATAIGTKAGIGAVAVATGASIATIKADAAVVKTGADDVATLNKPLIEEACYVEPWKPHSDDAKANIAHLCANVGTDPIGDFKNLVDLFKAIKAERAAAAAPVPQGQFP